MLMNFKKVAVRNFGPFPNAEFSFALGEVNVVMGYNGSGKTQLAGAMLAAIVGSGAAP